MPVDLPPLSQQSAGTLPIKSANNPTTAASLYTALAANTIKPPTLLQTIWIKEHIGQKLTATVLQLALPRANASGANLPGDRGTGPPFQVLLNVAGQKLTLPSHYRFEPGQRLNIAVNSESRIQVISVEQTTLERSRAIVEQGLRDALPRKGEILPLLNSLVSLSKSDSKTSPSGLTPLIRNLIGLIPKQQQVTNPKELQRSFNRSGLFMEANLKHMASPSENRNVTPADIKNDFKAQLLKLFQNLTNSESTAVKEKVDAPKWEKSPSTSPKAQISKQNSIITLATELTGFQ